MQFCAWCSSLEDVTDTLEVSPSINWLRVKNALSERAVEMEYNSQFVDEYEIQYIGSRESEVAGRTVSRDAVLTLDQIWDVIQGLEDDSLIRSKADIPICKYCASSLMDLD